MPIDVKDVYEQAFNAHRHASDNRAKIIGGWYVVYTAFAAVFAWSETNRPHVSWMIAVAGAVAILALWLADRRNRPAIKRAKDIGAHIEQDPTVGIPEQRHFFSKLDKGVSHRLLIDIFGWLSMVMFLGAALVLGPLGYRFSSAPGPPGRLEEDIHAASVQLSEIRQSLSRVEAQLGVQRNDLKSVQATLGLQGSGLARIDVQLKKGMIASTVPLPGPCCCACAPPCATTGVR